MKKILFLFALAASILHLSAAAPSVCVVDFMNGDIGGMKRFVDGRNKPLEIPEEQIIESPEPDAAASGSTPSSALLEGLKGSSLLANIMLTGSQSEQWQLEWPGAREIILVKDADFKLDEKRMRLLQERKILERILESDSRPVIIGAQHFEALLAAMVPGLKMVPRQVLYASMNKQAAAEDFPTDFLKRVSAESGVTHIITGTLSDIRSKARTFEGYGIKTESIVYEIDVMLKAVSIADGSVAAGGVYTGRASIRKQPGFEVIDNNTYQSAFNAALNSAAEDFAIELNELIAAERGNKEEK